MLNNRIQIRRRYIVLFVSVVVIIVGTCIAGGTQSNFGTVSVVEVDFQSMEDGSWIHSTLQTPKYASASNLLPGVVVIHGILQNKEWLMAFGIELARRGFVVLTIDANGHGNSDPGSGCGIAALEYLTGLSYVNSSSIGIIGHSMGGFIGWDTINKSTIEVNTFVLVGMEVNPSINSTYPLNILVTVGDFDELSDYPSNLSLLEKSFNVTPEIGKLYGSFNLKTARKVIFGDSNHLIETIDPTIIGESVEWMKDSLKGTEDEYWLPKENLIYQIFMIGGLIATIGVLLSILPILAILIDLPFFSNLKKTPSSSQDYTDTKSYLWQGLLYGVIGFALFLPLLMVGSMLRRLIPFPQSYGLEVGFYFLGSSLIAAGVLLILVRFRPELKSKLKESNDNTHFRNNLPIYAKTAFLALLVILWIYSWTLLLDVFFVLDFRCFLPVFNDLTPIRALIALIYLIPFIPYFLIEGKWLMQVIKTKPKESWALTQVIWSLKAIFIKCLPYTVLIAIQYGVGLFANITLIPGYIGFVFLFFYMFTPMFAISIVITVWSYHFTKQCYLGTLINAFMFSWILASILSIPV